MIIQNSRTTLQAGHVYQLQRTAQQQIRAWVGDRPSAPAPAPAPDQVGPAVAARPGGQSVDASSPDRARTTAPAVVAGVRAALTHRGTAGLSAAALRTVAVHASAGRVPGETGETGETGQGPAGAVEGRLATIVALIEWLTGQRVQVIDPAELGPGGGKARHGDGPDPTASPAVSPAAAGTPARAGWGLEVTTTETSVEVEATAVAGSASVTTADGRRIDVTLSLGYAREAIWTATSRFAAGDAAVTDPLMLGLAGPASLGTNRTAFDLNCDGVDEQVPDAGAGAAYLVLDRNGNGTLDDGGELLGPATGDGFTELAAYDQDGNGWIDEADPVFARLGLASSPHGDVTALADGGVGAIGLARVSSPFTFASGDRTSGVLRSTGIWIGEDGSGGAVQQIDIAT